MSSADADPPARESTERSAATSRTGRPVALALVAFVILIPLVLWPATRSFLDSLRDASGEFGFEPWRRVFDVERPAALRALFNSVWTSLASVALAGVLGTGLALLVARVQFPGRALLAGLAVLPLLLPPIVGVLTFKQFLFGEYGLIPQALRKLGLDVHLDGFVGVLVLHAYAFFPFFYLFVAAGQKRIDPSVVEAGVSLGADRGTLLRRVVLPLLKPALAGAAVLVLLNSMGSFSAPLFFAPAEEFLTLRIYSAREEDPALAAALATLLTVASFALLIPLRRFEGDGRAESASKGGALPPVAPPRGIQRAVLACLAAIGILALLLPHLSIVVLSLTKSTASTTTTLPTEFTLEHWRALFDSDAFLEPLRSSAWMATIAAAFDLVLGVYIAIVMLDRRTPFRGAVELLALLPMALPATVLAFNLLRAFGGGSALTFGHALSGTVALLPLAYVIRHLPIQVRAAQSALATIDSSMLDAAASLGASRVRILLRIAVPLVAPGILSGTLLCFLSGLTEFVASILLYVPENLPISVEIFNRRYNRSLGEPAALAVLLLVAQGSVLWFTNRFLRIERTTR